MDEIDIAILGCLQQDATMPVADVADRCGLSPSPCWRRIQASSATGPSCAAWPFSIPPK